jgi:hypothetical protein
VRAAVIKSSESARKNGLYGGGWDLGSAIGGGAVIYIAGGKFGDDRSATVWDFADLDEVEDP